MSAGPSRVPPPGDRAEGLSGGSAPRSARRTRRLQRRGRSEEPAGGGVPSPAGCRAAGAGPGAPADGLALPRAAGRRGAAGGRWRFRGRPAHLWVQRARQSPAMVLLNTPNRSSSGLDVPQPQGLVKASLPTGAPGKSEIPSFGRQASGPTLLSSDSSGGSSPFLHAPCLAGQQGVEDPAPPAKRRIKLCRSGSFLEVLTKAGTGGKRLCSGVKVRCQPFGPVSQGQRWGPARGRRGPAGTRAMEVETNRVTKPIPFLEFLVFLTTTFCLSTINIF